MGDIVERISKQLEELTIHHHSILQALDVIEEKACNNDEIIVVNVLRESFNELFSDNKDRGL